ncbi:EbsA family protein [Lactobacillus sp. ESL0791]|uniref:EbsA family protein n=1 Tax=Lactobacillus sp. ESL0791 TaxID=2983234 RepID=UPI0023F8237C|nr:EbsA family protein [Lactobacillus sp. ESL0791]MDF7638908.1 EbsA family protein [Lactobacillus sp. ESL0791]
MKKKHFILLGRTGIIYYCWLFIILFVGLVLAYEGAANISWAAIIVLSVFFVLLIYTLVNSYWNRQYLKLPYRPRVNLKNEPRESLKWGIFKFYQVKTSPLQTYYLLRITK